SVPRTASTFGCYNRSMEGETGEPSQPVRDERTAGAGGRPWTAWAARTGQHNIPTDEPEGPNLRNHLAAGRARRGGRRGHGQGRGDFPRGQWRAHRLPPHPRRRAAPGPRAGADRGPLLAALPRRGRLVHRAELPVANRRRRGTAVAGHLDFRLRLPAL